MREILFKGKRTDNGEWVEGCLLIDYVSGQFFIHANGNSVYESDKVNEQGCLRFFAFEVDPETVCRYTGLTDKNGKKIFEGDILEIETGNITKEDGYFTVEWSKPGSCFVLCGNRYLAHFDNCYEDCREVIGNIFDNPKLLEERGGENAD